MNTVPAFKYHSVEDYLAAEEVAEFKSEYYAGEIFSMAGGTVNHNQIIINLCIILVWHLRNAIAGCLPAI